MNRIDTQTPGGVARPPRHRHGAKRRRVKGPPIEFFADKDLRRFRRGGFHQSPRRGGTRKGLRENGLHRLTPGNRPVKVLTNGKAAEAAEGRCDDAQRQTQTL